MILDAKGSELHPVLFGLVSTLLGATVLSAGAVAQQPGDDLGFFASRQADFRVEVVATGFEEPFAMAVLPDGRLLVTDRPRRSISIVDPSTGMSEQVSGLPAIFYEEEVGGGLTDLVLHPDYEDNGWLYFNYAYETDQGISMAISRARLDGTALVDHQRLFVTDPPVPENASHLGSRIVIADGYLFFTMGERYSMREEAQDNTNHHGTVLRLHDDGRVPADNPFIDSDDVLSEIWSYGHRNPQGMARNPNTGELWANEHGPKGGDEINVIHPGRNYGWPVITYGEEYDDEGGGPIGAGLRQRPGMEQPIYYYRPSIGPSDMVFYSGDAFPEWKGDVLMGGMALTHLNRLEIQDGRVIHEERMLGDLGRRVRAIEEGHDGLIYVGVDEGEIWRLVPVEHGN